MLRIYKKVKGKLIKYDNCEGVICGYTDNRLLIAVEDKPECSFRQREAKQEMFVEEEFKDEKYRYVYCDEMIVYRQHKKLKHSFGV